MNHPVGTHAPGTAVARGLALGIGSGGGLGAALLARLERDARYARTLGLGRYSQVPVDYFDESSLAAAAQHVAKICSASQLELRLLIVATGFLHGEPGQPERSWANLDAGYLEHVFKMNTLGPALVMKHFFPLLPKQGRCVAGFMSAKVGSIGDNALGGWYGYRASKAALNQLVKTASIELTRRNRQSVCVALHPGTVATALSEPFSKTGLNVRSATDAARDVLMVLQNLVPEDTGCLVDYLGQKLPF
jgi:NAD(P)-dependent dehydrogenase (short-subunit alcohol dehydrogenase family)